MVLLPAESRSDHSYVLLCEVNKKLEGNIVSKVIFALVVVNLADLAESSHQLIV